MQNLTFILVAVFVLFFGAINSLFILGPTEQALVLQFGDFVRTEREPGLKMKLPFIQNVVVFDKRLLDIDIEPKEINASDQKRIIIDSFVRYHITDPLRFYQTVNNEDGMRDRLNDIVEASLKKIVGSNELRALLSGKREEIMHAILQDVANQVRGQVPKNSKDTATAAVPEGGFGAEVVDVRIYGADLPETNSRAVYSRMETDRQSEAKQLRAQGEEQAQIIRSNAERERAEVLAEAQKEAETIRGQADAVASKIYADAYSRDAEFFEFYRSLQAYRHTLQKDNTKFVISPDNDFFKYMESRQH